MEKTSTLVGIILLAGGMVTGLSVNASAEESLIPIWIRNTAGFWADGQINDQEFISALQYLVKEGILVIPLEERNSLETVKDELILNGKPSSISRITNFVVNGDPEEEKYVLRFTLMDPNQQQISEEGVVSIVIYDDVDDVLYSNSFSIKESDFGIYELVLTGNDFLAYVWEIPTSEVMQGVGTYGRASLVFTDNSGNDFRSEDSINIPEFTDAELAAKHEEDFLRTATPINLSLENEGFEIELTVGGAFTHQEYAWSDKITDYRVNAIIKNNSNEPIRFSVYDGFIQTTDGRQFESTSRGTIESGKILPGSIVEGSILFETGNNFGDIKSLIIDGEFVFDLQDNRTYTFEQLRDEEYNNNAIIVEKSINKGSFEITLVKAGLYSESIFADIIEGFRADLVFENIGSETEYVPLDIVLLDGKGNQFDRAYYSNLEFKQIHPGVKHSGYVFFEDYQGDSSKVTIVVTSNSYPDDFIWKWDVILTN